MLESLLHMIEFSYERGDFVDIDQGIHKGEMNVTRNEKQKKTTWVFFFHKHSKF